MRQVHLFNLSVCWNKLAGLCVSLIESVESEKLHVHYFSRKNKLFDSGGIWSWEL